MNILGEELELNYIDLKANGPIIFEEHSAYFRHQMPNPLHKVAGGLDLVTSFALMWADDVRGTVTKLINAHRNIYLAHSNLLGSLLQQEFFICFVSTSQHATTPEQFEAIKCMIEQTHQEPPLTYHAHSKRMCRFHIVIPGLPADNPQQSELNFKCCRCFVGGPAAHTESSEGYHALHEPGAPGMLSLTKEEIRNQIKTAADGSIGSVKDLQTASGVKDRIFMLNLCNSGLDPHHDTPVEILHTILLGIIKYVWHNLHTTMKEKDRPKFVTRLQSSDIRGLSIPPIRAAYMTQYRNALIGKHFKMLMQVMPFHVYGLVTPSQFILIKAAGCLGAIVWFHEISNMTEYLVCV
ncbi:hypothetical protein K439DRAFT_1647660 [Ramaria rubella]|nr:hypothetical protein K439DRAFT_1647660 [Ramaria rubella]